MGKIRNVIKGEPSLESPSRRDFLLSVIPAAAAGAALAATGGSSGVPWIRRAFRGDRWKERVGGEIVGALAHRGHLIRNSPSYDGRRVREGGRFGVVIIGGGISGLSAAWELSRSGFTDYRLLELHTSVGGNAVGGTIAGVSHPWGAHYLPVPNRESELVRELLADIGEVEGTNAPGSPPRYKEESLVAAPAERLFHHGKWRSGLVPQYGIAPSGMAQHERFFARMREYQEAIGSDGRPAFAIPLELSSTDTTFTQYDRVPFSEWIKENRFDNSSLLWYIDYCCRDDYGATASQISAWAGIHYFSSRRGWSSNAEADELLTWGDGNNHLVRGLAKFSSANTIQNAVVLDVRATEKYSSGATGNREREFTIVYRDALANEDISIRASSVILATPLHTHRYLLRDSSVSAVARVHDTVAENLHHNPWVVANLSLTTPPDGPGSSVAWDNVLYGSESLGYISATHQKTQVVSGRTVLTYYLPKPLFGNALGRESIAATGWERWRDEIVQELSIPHKRLTEYLERIDIWLWGHGMAAPSPGFLWGGENGRIREARTSLPGVFVAHSDCSGVSLFEQAQWWGVQAARGARSFLS